METRKFPIKKCSLQSEEPPVDENDVFPLRGFGDIGIHFCDRLNHESGRVTPCLADTESRNENTAVEGSYILRPLRVVTRVRRWRLAAGEGRESRRVVAKAARSDLHTLTHTYTYLRTRVSVTRQAQ